MPKHETNRENHKRRKATDCSLPRARRLVSKHAPKKRYIGQEEEATHYRRCATHARVLSPCCLRQSARVRAQREREIGGEPCRQDSRAAARFIYALSRHSNRNKRKREAAGFVSSMVGQNRAQAYISARRCFLDARTRSTRAERECAGGGVVVVLSSPGHDREVLVRFSLRGFPNHLVDHADVLQLA